MNEAIQSERSKIERLTSEHNEAKQVLEHLRAEAASCSLQLDEVAETVRAGRGDRVGEISELTRRHAQLLGRISHEEHAVAAKARLVSEAAAQLHRLEFDQNVVIAHDNRIQVIEHFRAACLAFGRYVTAVQACGDLSRESGVQHPAVNGVVLNELKMLDPLKDWQGVEQCVGGWWWNFRLPPLSPHKVRGKEHTDAA